MSATAAALMDDIVPLLNVAFEIVVLPVLFVSGGKITDGGEFDMFSRWRGIR